MARRSFMAANYHRMGAHRTHEARIVPFKSADEVRCEDGRRILKATTKCKTKCNEIERIARAKCIKPKRDFVKLG